MSLNILALVLSQKEMILRTACYLMMIRKMLEKQTKLRVCITLHCYNIGLCLANKACSNLVSSW